MDTFEDCDDIDTVVGGVGFLEPESAVLSSLISLSAIVPLPNPRVERILFSLDADMFDMMLKRSKKTNKHGSALLFFLLQVNSAELLTSFDCNQPS